MRITIDSGLVTKRESKFTDLIEQQEYSESHHAHAFSTYQLAEIEKYLPLTVENSVETGCGKSTVLFSNIANKHRVFALGDTAMKESSVNFFKNHPLGKKENVEFYFGPTQKTLQNFDHKIEYDIALIDGAHAYPFPELDYLSIYPFLKKREWIIDY
jgi:hypothetical protein